MANGQICRENNCHYCCIETEMLLTNKDIRNIGKTTGIKADKYVRITKEGHKMLQNRMRGTKAQCFFLNNEGLCEIYEARPEGCQFYPIIWDMEKHLAIRDDICPYLDNFEINVQISKKLKFFILKLFGKA